MIEKALELTITVTFSGPISYGMSLLLWLKPEADVTRSTDPVIARMRATADW